MNKIYPLLPILILISFISCKGEPQYTELFLGDKTISVEIADTNELRENGLMNRKTMENNRGMLFVFEKERNLSFWMKNTYIPLSIAYISRSGEIKEIYDMEPLNENPVKSNRSVLYALEMNQGWFRENNIEVGDSITIPENF